MQKTTLKKETITQMSEWGRLSATPFVETKAVFERDQTLLLIFSF